VTAIKPDAPKQIFPLRWVAVGGALLAAALVAWYFLAFRQDFAVLYRDLRPTEASSIVAELEKQGMPYRLADGGAQILVPTAVLDETRVKLASSAAPLGGVDGFELFDGSDLGLTEFAQKIRYQRALQGELSRTIMMMEGVAEARVHLSIPERTLFRGERRNAKAAITLVMHSEADLTADRIEGVQRLIASAVADLAVNDVVVLNARGEVLSSHTDAITVDSRRFTPGAAAAALPSLDHVMNVIRTAIPNKAFEVSITPTPPDLVGADSAAAAAFSLPYVISIRTPAPLAALELEGAANALREAGLVDRGSGGTISFQSAPDNRTRARTVQSNPRELNSQNEAGFPATGVAAIMVLMASLAGAGFWYWRRFLRGKMSDEERSQFADLLKSALQAPEQERV
jgi:flagellar M-ring protein FliF